MCNCRCAIYFYIPPSNKVFVMQKYVIALLFFKKLRKHWLFIVYHDGSINMPEKEKYACNNKG